MKLIIRYFFKLVHIIVGPVILLWDALTTPKGIVRSSEKQREADAGARQLVLYQFRMCPFSVKVRRAIKRLSLNIETRDALREKSSRRELLQGGGEIKVPCLHITDDQGSSIWMYESDAIIEYLQNRFA